MRLNDYYTTVILQMQELSTETLSNLSKVTQLASGRAGIQTQTVWLWSPDSEPLGNFATNGAWSMRVCERSEWAILIAWTALPSFLVHIDEDTKIDKRFWGEKRSFFLSLRANTDAEGWAYSAGIGVGLTFSFL